MDKLQALFITEAEELMLDLERALLEFEKDINSKASVQDIFRVMHTLKGSGSMFGFDTLSALTHDLETIYDDIREGRLTADHEILEITLRTVDHLKKLIRDPELVDARNKANHDALLNQIRSLQGSRQEGDKRQPSTALHSATYYIQYKPHPEIFRNGTNPLYLVDDLAGLGDALVIPHLDMVPELDDIAADTSYTSFEVILVTDKPEPEIHDVFIFVEDKCKIIIEKLADENLLAIDAFRKTFSATDYNLPLYGAEIIKTIAETVRQTETAQRASVKAVPKNENVTSIRVTSDKLDELMNLVSELVTSQARLSLIAANSNLADLVNLSENIEKISRRLRDNAFTICLVPVETLVTRFQRLVRDLAKDLKKEISFRAEGTDTELDKSIIENITDPILHILRNCIDHGIELPAEREQKGKSRQGSIHFKAFHSGTYVYIQIRDDGRGIDVEKIREKAISRGLITADSSLSENEVFQLIFTAGFSTAEKITDVSGRGVGMDIVKRNIEAIHGEVSVRSKVNEGTTITIKLPLTLSIVDGMLVRIGSSEYILPLTAVDKCYEIESVKIQKEISQKHIFDGSLLPVFNLQEAFKEQHHSSSITQVIKIRYEEFPVGITVDAIIGEYQAVMKPLGDLYREQDEFSGATILGDGTVALVLDTDKLIKQLIQHTALTIV